MLVVKDLFAGYNGTDIIFNINLKVQKSESLCVLGQMDAAKVLC